MNQTDENRLDLAAEPARTERVFLKVLQDGDRVSLFSYRDAVKERFYILPVGSDTPDELQYAVQKKENQLQSFATYRTQLHQLALKYPEYGTSWKNLIESATYTKNKLLQVVQAINKTNPQKVTTQGGSRRFLRVAVNASSLQYNGRMVVNADGLGADGNPKYKNSTTVHSFLPAVALGYDIFFKPAVRRSYLRVELSAVGVQSKIQSFYKFPSPYDEELKLQLQDVGRSCRV